MNALSVSCVLICAISLFFLKNKTTNDSFYKGTGENGQAPGLFTLVLSQTTTWIFARSLLNAAILGFYYGFWGTFAYACYYLSFLSGWKIIDTIRFKHRHENIQSFLIHRYGGTGSTLYNALIILRLISEVFANLLVIGLLFGVANSTNYFIAIILFSLFTLFYSVKGGLGASLVTDRFQMILFLIMLCLLLVASNLMTDIDFFATVFISASFDAAHTPGIILVFVALLQFISYPMHDPVMMDRGFLADRQTTKKSFFYAFYLSFICIILFGTFGIIAAQFAEPGMSMQTSLEQLMGTNLFLIFNLCLVVSAVSTLDSTLSSSAKLFIIDMKFRAFGLQHLNQITQGRLVMTAFLMLGLFLLALNNQDLFSAVALSGTASMFLLPVITMQIFGDDKPVARWSYVASFVVSFAASVLYFVESSKGVNILPAVFGSDHKYTKLLIICLFLCIVNHGLFIAGRKSRQTTPSTVT